MRLTTLGTSCAQQTLTRTQSAHALSITPSVTYLVDCGSSTATLLLQSGIKESNIHKVFITHLHTDHVIGLTGLLTDILGGHGGKIEDFEAGVKRDGGPRRKLDIYGPCGTKEFIRTTFRLTYTILAHCFRIHELLFESDPVHESEAFLREEDSRDIKIGEDGAWTDISKDDRCRVTAVPIKHSVPCLGYIITEDDSTSLPDTVIAQIKQQYHQGSIEFKSAIAQLRSGGQISLSDSKIGPLPREKGRQVVLLGDTSDASAVLKHVKPPTSLVLHESTNAYLPQHAKSSETLVSVQERAISRGHSTPELAGEFARLCGSDILVLTHFSSRYSGADVKGARKVMEGFEKLAALAGTADQESVEALFADELAPYQKKPRKGPSNIANGKKDKAFQGRVIAAWDGMYVDIPRTGVFLGDESNGHHNGETPKK